MVEFTGHVIKNIYNRCGYQKFKQFKFHVSFDKFGTTLILFMKNYTVRNNNAYL